MNDAELKRQLTPVYGVTPFYRLRWRFDFADRQSKMSQWNYASQNDVKAMAAFVKKDGLIRASIEGEKVGSWVIRTLFECDGHEYASMEWMTATSVPVFINKTVIRAGQMIGLSILTAKEKTTVFIDGQVKKRPLDQYETKMNLTEHSMGV